MGADKRHREMRDIMPSKGLVIHEYRTHGTCSGLDPVQYFGVARELYERGKILESLAASGARQSLSADQIESATLILGSSPT